MELTTENHEYLNEEKKTVKLHLVAAKRCAYKRWLIVINTFLARLHSWIRLRSRLLIIARNQICMKTSNPTSDGKKWIFKHLITRKFDDHRWKVQKSIHFKWHSRIENWLGNHWMANYRRDWALKYIITSQMVRIYQV